ncbi:hypothetical protein CHARACLAT_000870 [Characodon lateralis]|uniref:Uncharacterized protein n=1 Tax=Characodon lateralis TaxID=208331 RepID=A0ABU7DF35_9TELE|nr:hypothetical protein [Characodon lateralis]
MEMVKLAISKVVIKTVYCCLVISFVTCRSKRQHRQSGIKTSSKSVILKKKKGLEQKLALEENRRPNQKMIENTYQTPSRTSLVKFMSSAEAPGESLEGAGDQRTRKHFQLG